MIRNLAYQHLKTNRTHFTFMDKVMLEPIHSLPFSRRRGLTGSGARMCDGDDKGKVKDNVWCIWDQLDKLLKRLSFIYLFTSVSSLGGDFVLTFWCSSVGSSLLSCTCWEPFFPFHVCCWNMQKKKKIKNQNCFEEGEQFVAWNQHCMAPHWRIYVKTQKITHNLKWSRWQD